MHAVVLESFGDATCLRAGEFPDPLPEPGWVTVRLRTAALNWHDVLVRQGRYRSPLPHVIGADGAGVRTDTGEEVMILPSLFWGDDDSAPGDGWQILGDVLPGTYAELVRVPADCLVPKPRRYDWVEAAALPLVGVTAYRALFTRAGLRRGESLLILGAGGGVATMAVALAAAVGARVVVTSSSDEKIERARNIGAFGGVLYTDAAWPSHARRLSASSRGFDVVLDAVGDWSNALAALRPGGRLVVLGASRSNEATLQIPPFYFGQYGLLGTTMGNARDFRGLMSLLESQDVHAPVVDRVFPLEQAADAHAYLERGGGFGKVVLEQP